MSKKRKQNDLFSHAAAAKISAGGEPTDSGALFPNGGGSLTSALFGEAPVNSNNDDLFSSTSKFETAVQQRINDNANKTARRQESSQCPAKGTAVSTCTKEDVVAQRRARAESSFIDEITIQAPFPANQQDDDTETDDNDFEIPLDVAIDEIADTVRTNGFAVVQNVVSKSLLDTLSSRAREIEQNVCKQLDEDNITWKCDDEEPCTFRFHEVASRCKGRMDVRYETNQEPFTLTEIVNNKSLSPIVNSLLGGSTVADDDALLHGPTLLYAGLIFSLAGSDDQPWHQDGMPLFPEINDMMLPPYAINIFLPLTNVDASIEAGPTEFIPLSHVMEEAAVLEKIDKCTNRNVLGDGATGSGDARANDVASEEHGEEVQEEHPGIVSPRLNQGDALLYDYRVCHRGTSNLTQGTRRILYLMYARPWFKEHLNFGTKRLFPEANWRE